MISVLCPTRHRINKFERSYESLTRAADRPQDVEFLAAVDPDDTSLATYGWYSGVMWVAPERFGYDGLHRYYQGLAEIARGDWLLVWNDDCEMTTPGWDTVIGKLSPDIMIADIQTPHSPLCCFPAIRRRAVEALGRFSSDNPHVDTFWQDVGNATGIIASVPVYAHCETPVKPDQTHGYYDGPHQAELATCTQLLRERLGR